MKVNGVTDDAFRLYLFPHSLTHYATAWFDRFPRNSINTFEKMAKMFLEKYFPPSMVTKLKNKITNFRQRPDESLFEAWERYKLLIDRCPNHNMLPVTQIDTFFNGLTLRHRDTINAAAGETFMKRRPEECYDLIENMIAHHNDWDTSDQQSESSSSVASSSSNSKSVALKAKMAEINKNLMKVFQINQQVKAVTSSCETCGGPHSYNDCPAIVGQTQNVYTVGAIVWIIISNHQGSIKIKTETIKIRSSKIKTGIKETIMVFLRGTTKEETNSYKELVTMNTASSSGSGTLPSNTITNPKGDLKGITTRSETAYQGPMIPTTSSFLPKVVECETKVTKDTVPPTNNESTKYVQPPNGLMFSPGRSRRMRFSELTPTLMTLELADRSISRPIGVAEDVFVKVGKFHFPADFVVIDFDADTRVPLILERSFLKTRKALIDVYAEELTLRVNNEAVTFNLDQTSRYSANYNDMTAN
nr:reverse transcriptase domain-containing protein [Tanacetum cinerariifolium]